MKHNQSRLGSRRQTRHMPIVPFKDSSGMTIWGCRRKISDRRAGNLQATLNGESMPEELHPGR
jgi:hypothetical protein